MTRTFGTLPLFRGLADRFAVRTVAPVRPAEFKAAVEQEPAFRRAADEDRHRWLSVAVFYGLPG